MAFIALYKEAKLPTKVNPSAAGIDVYTYEDATLPPHKFYWVSTGVRKTPSSVGYTIHPVSSNHKNFGEIIIYNGVIDADYDGEVLVGIYNIGETPVHIPPFSRVAQLLPIPSVELDPRTIIPIITLTARGNFGFGELDEHAATSQTLSCSGSTFLPEWKNEAHPLSIEHTMWALQNMKLIDHNEAQKRKPESLCIGSNRRDDSPYGGGM
jgi:dUTP pyrophosphatase